MGRSRRRCGRARHSARRRPAGDRHDADRVRAQEVRLSRSSRCRGRAGGARPRRVRAERVRRRGGRTVTGDIRRRPGTRGRLAGSECVAAEGAPLRETFDVVLARAVGSLATVVELAAPLLAQHGTLLVGKTATAARDEGPRGEAAARECGLTVRAVVALANSPLRSSVCVVYEKTAATPPSLPRREGRARSRPLGGQSG